MTLQYHELAAGRWTQLAFVEQMAHIGSEVERALRWRTQHKPDYAQRAFERALELLDLTLASATRAPQRRELARAREVWIDFFVGENRYASTADSWRAYFTPFTTATRRHA